MKDIIHFIHIRLWSQCEMDKVYVNGFLVRPKVINPIYASRTGV